MRIEPTVHLIKLISIIFFWNFNYFAKLHHMKCAPTNDEISYEYLHTHKKKRYHTSINQQVGRREPVHWEEMLGQCCREPTCVGKLNMAVDSHDVSSETDATDTEKLNPNTTCLNHHPDPIEIRMRREENSTGNFDGEPRPGSVSVSRV